MKEATRWRLYYKCRLCGEIESSQSVQDMKEIAHEKYHLSSHACQDGGYGITDLMGVREYEVDKGE